MQKWQKNLYAVWFTQFLSLMGFGFGLPFLPFFIQDLGITDPVQLKIWTGWLTSAPALAMAVMAPVWGILADRVGKKAMLLRAMGGGMLVMTGLALSRTPEAVMAFRILQGLLTGTVTSSAALVASGTPDNRMSYALGFLSSSTFIGYSLGPAVGGIIAEYWGYRISFLIGTGIVFIGLLLVIFFIREPEGKPAPVPAAPAGRKAKSSGIITTFMIMLFVLFFFVRMSRVMPTAFLPLFIQEMRGTVEGSAKITGILSGGIGLMAAVSGLTLSKLGDRMNRLRLLTVLVAAGALSSSLIIFFPGFRAVVFSLLLTYFLIGGIEPLLMSISSSRVDSENRGFLFGIQTAVGSSAWFASPVVGSYVAITYSTSSVFLVFTMLLALTAVVAFTVMLRQPPRSPVLRKQD